MGTLGICLHYIEIETPQDPSSDISKQLNQHLCAAAYADCDPANVNGAAAVRTFVSPFQHTETHGVKRRQCSGDVFHPSYIMTKKPPRWVMLDFTASTLFSLQNAVSPQVCRDFFYTN